MNPETKFMEACGELLAVEQKFREGALSSVDHAWHRERRITEAMTGLAAEKGVRLQGMQIRSGEFMVVALPEGATHAMYGAGKFGDFAELLNRHRPRTGTLPGAVLQPESGWCHLGHFEAERLVLEEYQARMAAADVPAHPAPRGG